MNLKKIVMDLRISHNLKGKYPLVVFTIPNQGGVHNNGKRYYVMTYRQKENDIYFHGLTKFFHKYNEKYDFSLNLDKFNHYTLEAMPLGASKFSLVSYKNDYFPVGFFTGTHDTYEGENNLSYMIEELNKKGITLIDILESTLKKEAEKMAKKELSEREKRELINRIEHPERYKNSNSDKKEMYLSQTDRNYKDGDRN
jgi:hypothetical protein